MKQSNIDKVAKAICAAADIKSGNIVYIEYNDTVSQDILQACKREAERADAGGVVLDHQEDYSYAHSLYLSKFDVKNSAQSSWLLAIAPAGNLGDVFNMNADDAEEAYVRMCTMDYSVMKKAMEPLANVMTKARDVRITGVNTDLTFQLEDIPAVYIPGKYNIPCGECFSAPVKESLNGTILYGASEYRGEKFAQIFLTYQNGRIVEALAENEDRTRALNAILDLDEGSRYTGEFAIACNPYVLNPIGNPLLDEKIAGSLHIAQGFCLASFAPNSNTKAAIHWDTVQIQRPEHGGGEIWFDGELIRKNGLFLPEDLKPLNPENLKLII